VSCKISQTGNKIRQKLAWKTVSSKQDKGNSVLHPSWVDKSSTSLSGWSYGRVHSRV